MALRAIYILFEIPVFFYSPCSYTGGGWVRQGAAAAGCQVQPGAQQPGPGHLRRDGDGDAGAGGGEHISTPSVIYISTHHPYIYTFCIQVGYIAGQHEVVADCITTELCKVDTHLDIQRLGGFLTRRIVWLTTLHYTIWLKDTQNRIVLDTKGDNLYFNFDLTCTKTS